MFQQRNRSASILGLLLLPLIAINALYAYVIDNNVYTPPDYLSFIPPSAPGSYTDAVFAAGIKRLSDSMHMTDAGTGGTLATVGTEYSTMSPFNQDNTRLLLLHLSYFGLYDGSGNFLRNLPFEINASSEPRWSRTDPNVLYFRRTNQLKRFNVGTNTMSIVHTFSEYSTISGAEESDICFDGDHFVLVGNGRYVFVYEVSSDTKGAVFDTAGASFDSVYITPNDNVTIKWNTVGTTRFRGIELFDRNMNFLRQATRANGHMDVTRDVNGDEVLVWMNSADPNPICNNGVVKVRLADASQTCLLSLDWTLAAHVSATDNTGWVFVGTYAPADPLPPSNWFRYTNELIQIRLDGSQSRRLTHHRSRPFNGYVYTPRLSVSRDGSKLVYSSNFGLQQILGNPTQYSDAFMIDLAVASPDTVGNPSGGAGGGSTTVSASPTSASTGGTVNAAWSGIASPTGTDWIGLYSPAAGNTSYTDWFYVNCSWSPGAPLVSGSCGYVLGNLTPGTYQFRLFTNNGFTVLATSNDFTVTSSSGGGSGPSISVSPSLISSGGTVTGTWSGIPSPSATDWLGLYRPGVGNTSYLDWRFVSCSMGAASPRAAGSCPFVLPGNLTPGTYELRLLGNNGYIDLARSNSFTINSGP